MPELDADARGKLGFGLYLLIGVPIALRFMQQQKMTASSKQSGTHRLVVLILAIMWPVLLFAMFVNYLQDTERKPKTPQSQGTSDGTAQEDDKSQRACREEEREI